MKFQHIYHAVHCEPWLILETAHGVIAQLVESRMGMTAAEFSAQRPKEGIFGESLPVMTVASGIAEIPIFGTIGKGLGALEKSCGATSVEDVRDDFAEAVGRRDVSGILLNINSPGGTITGLPELASVIRRASAAKPVVAFTDGTMASAAYWLGSQADMIVASESAKIGSIGVFFPWVDRSKQAEALGLKVEAITNKEGTYKGMGLPGTSLTKEQRQHLEASADEIFAMFKRDIAARRTVSVEAMRGQTMFAGPGRKAGLCDDVGDYDHARKTLSSLVSMRSGQNRG